MRCILPRGILQSPANLLFNLCLPLYLAARRDHVGRIAARWKCMPDVPPFRPERYYRRRLQLFSQALRDHGSPHLPAGAVCRGREHLTKALATGKPLLIAGIHLGPFEWLHKAPYRDVLAANRIYRVVTAPAFSTLLNRYVTRGRAAPGKEIVFNQSLSKAVKQTLRECGVLACMLDQNPDWLSNPLQCWDRLRVPAADKLLDLFIKQGGVVLPISAFKDKEEEGRVVLEGRVVFHSPLGIQSTPDFYSNRREANNSAGNAPVDKGRADDSDSREANGRARNRDPGESKSNTVTDGDAESGSVATGGSRQWLTRWLEEQIQANPWEYNWSYPGLGPR